MQVSLVTDIEQFDQLKNDWEDVYSVDPHAHIFVSWMWLRSWFEMTPYRWFVLVVRPDGTSPYVAFFPLMMRGLRIYKFSPIRVLHMGGRPFSYYTGFVCLPEYEEEALAAFARYIQQQLGWDRFQIEDVLDPRLELFLDWFNDQKYDVRQFYSMPSLYIPLPGTWDSYLQDYLSSKTRKNLRRSIRNIENHSNLCITQAQEDTVESDIEVLLTLWQRRWGPKPMARWHRAILHRFFENNALWLRVLWDGPTPVAARAGIIDPQKRTFYAYFICHNAEYAKLSPGKTLVGHSIRYAIENGFQAYDFLVGADDHKLSFGAKQRSTRSSVIRRKGPRSTIANAVVNLTRSSSESIKRLLGRIKRSETVKKMWFWLLGTIKRAKQ